MAWKYGGIDMLLMLLAKAAEAEDDGYDLTEALVCSPWMNIIDHTSNLVDVLGFRHGR
jgi:hypothetical protein